MIALPLTKGFIAVIDDEDSDLCAYSWWASGAKPGQYYPQRYQRVDGRPGKKHLHREIGERIHGGPIPPGMVVDHIDGDTMNNRRSNLRIVTHTENTWNQTRASRRSGSGIVGVRRHRERWQAYICTGPKMRVLGTFDTAEEARQARLAAEAQRLSAALSREN